MKKYLVKFIFMAFATLFLFSCNDEFLERYPLDRISNKTYWNTEEDLKVYNNTLYNMAKNDVRVPIMMGHGVGEVQAHGIWSLDEFADNMASRDDRHIEYTQLRSGKHITPTNNQIYGWGSWDFIRAINFGLENYDKADIAQSVKDKYIGEARLFRGWFYADKVSKFGDITWIDKELNTISEELYSPRTPREIVMENVLSDLNFAVENLPDDWGDGNAPGRLNRWAALLVKSRVCLFEGTWQKYHGGSDVDSWLEQAANAAEELMDNGPYHLYSTGRPNSDYNAIHRMDDLSGIPEVIYWRRYDRSISLVNNLPNYGIGRSYFGGATKSLIDDYLCIDGLPITLSNLYKGDEIFENIFENRDPRLRQSILHPEDQSYYKYGNHDYGTYTYPRLQGLSGGYYSTTGYHIIKVYNNDYVIKGYNEGDFPAITLRFAEALLNYAEAKAELGTIRQEDLDKSINLLRDRVGMPPMDITNIPVDPRYENDGVNAVIIEIRRERRIELFMEGFRYDDLRRWKQGKKLEIPDYGIRWDNNYKLRFDPDGKVNLKTSEINGIPYIDVYKGTSWENPVFDESKHYLWPIPLKAISQNTNLAQNPGWSY